jgi:hypothetical protein
MYPTTVGNSKTDFVGQTTVSDKSANRASWKLSNDAAIEQ